MTRWSRDVVCAPQPFEHGDLASVRLGNAEDRERCGHGCMIAGYGLSPRRDLHPTCAFLTMGRRDRAGHRRRYAPPVIVDVVMMLVSPAICVRS